ncbi:hypothetical protein [Chamaesiphon sp. OTE_20_metabat_361]|uniref:hypothetical protein n=1 Tax=Chamaesiphon sp. OTE_20_metabat_361 TaxID=2964689 RepID=UPI00286AD706|nr:hypothetical protein [Chamaesiphon sp. OTE_20_metabat_361]
MKLETYQIAVYEYLNQLNYAVINDDERHKLIQLNNLKLVRIEAVDRHKYLIQEVILGLAGQRWNNIDASTAIAHIQMLEVGINWEVLEIYISQVLEMQSAGII